MGDIGAMIATSPGLDVGIPKILEYQNHINKDIIRRDNLLPAGLSCKHGPDEIRAVTQAPDDKEEERQAHGRLNLVVFIYLR